MIEGKSSDCPCYGCDKRELGCHGKCQAYQAWHGVRETIRKARYDQNESLFTVGSATQKKIWRRMKRDRRKGYGRE